MIRWCSYILKNKAHRPLDLPKMARAFLLWLAFVFVQFLGPRGASFMKLIHKLIWTWIRLILSHAKSEEQVMIYKGRNWCESVLMRMPTDENVHGRFGTLYISTSINSTFHAQMSSIITALLTSLQLIHLYSEFSEIRMSLHTPCTETGPCLTHMHFQRACLDLLVHWWWVLYYFWEILVGICKWTWCICTHYMTHS